MIHDMTLPNIDASQLEIPVFDKCQSTSADHAPRILTLRLFTEAFIQPLSD